MTKMTQEVNPKVDKAKPRDRGYIYRQKGTTRWTVQYYLNGKSVREATGTNDYRAAQQKLTQRLASMDKGEIVPLRRKAILISELFKDLEADYIRRQRRSLKALRLRWSHLEPRFGNHSSIWITKDTVLSYIDQRLAEGAARATVNCEVAALKKMLNLAADKLPHKIPTFPEKLDRCTVRKGFIEDAEFEQLVSNARSQWMRTFLEVAYSVCWRSSEVLGLRVRQVDLKDRLLRLEAEDTKSGKARESAMTEKMYQLLKECVAGKAKDEFVLTRPTRQGHKPVRNFRKSWKKLCTAAGLPELLVHDLRRSGARQLRKAGVAESTIMASAGWATREMFRRYDIQDAKDKHHAMAALEQKRALDKLEREKEQAQDKLRHSFDHNRALGGKNELDTSTGWKN